MIKVDIISGFLGAGKTTLIKKLLESGIAKEKVVLIENEFGEIGIDGGFLKNAGVEIKEINSGCICCSLVGDFSTAMKEIVERFNPERIIIEPSGVGKLSDIIKAVENTDLGLNLNIIATVVDGGKCKMYMKNFGEFFLDQIKQANTIVISKLEKLSQEKLLASVELVKQENPHANIITTPIEKLENAKLLEVLEYNASMVKRLLKLINAEHTSCTDDNCSCHDHDHEDGSSCSCHDHDHEHGSSCDCNKHNHHADEVFESWGKETALLYSHQEITDILDNLKNDRLGTILRSKGFVNASDNEKWYYFDFVAGDYEIRLGNPDYAGRVCVIGNKLETQEINKLFDKRN
jgi:G3E family GTPase